MTGQYGPHSGKHYGGSPLWRRDPQAVQAMNNRTRLRGRRGRPEIGQRWQLYGCLVTVAAVNKPYGWALQQRSNRVHHLTDRMCLVWRDGHLLGAQAMWLCGSTTEHFDLLDAPPAGVPLCALCGYTAGRVGLTIVDQSVTIGHAIVIMPGSPQSPQQ